MSATLPFLKPYAELIVLIAYLQIQSSERDLQDVALVV